MKSQSIKYSHTICLIACFTLGSAAIKIPFEGASSSSLLGFVAAAIISIAVAVLLSSVFSSFFNPKHLENKNTRMILLPLYIAASLFILFDAAVSFNAFCDFVRLNMLEKTSRLIISGVFALCVYWASLNRDRVILKFSLITFILTAAAVIVFFVFLFPSADLGLLIPKKTSAREILKETENYLLMVFLPAAPILIYEKLTFGATKRGISAVGVTFGGIMLCVILCSSVMLFGIPQSAELSFPYADAISTISIGYLFTRMDGFAYFVFFATALIKVTVCILLIEKLFEGYKNGCRKRVSTAAAILLFLAANGLGFS